MNEDDKMLTKLDFWAALGIRALRTTAQTAASTLAFGAGLFGWDWVAAVSVALGAGVAAVLTGVAWPRALPEVPARRAAD